MVRYADDFVVVSSDTRAGVREAKSEIKDYMEKELKLTLSVEKTKITHVNEGFDFLGFNIQRRKTGGKMGSPLASQTGFYKESQSEDQSPHDPKPCIIGRSGQTFQS